MPSFNNHIRVDSDVLIACCNCRGLCSKLSEVHNPVHSFDIWFLQETKLLADSQIHSKIYNFVRNDIDDPGQCGVAIAVKKHIKFDTVDLSQFTHSSLELIGINICINNYPCLVVNIYRHPNTRTPQTILNQLLKYISTQTQALIVGDFNAHLTSRGCPSNDATDR